MKLGRFPFFVFANNVNWEIDVYKRQHIHCLLHLCEAMGCEVRMTDRGIFLKSARRLFAIEDIHTQPFPGFPTDMQSQLMAVLTTARGESTIYELSLIHI